MSIREKLKNWLANVLFIILIISAFVAFAWGFYYITGRMHEKEWEDEKICFKELTNIVETSSRGKADWIKNTIMAERSALGGPQYCRVLELVREIGARKTTNQKGK